MPFEKLESLHKTGGLRMYAARIIYINGNDKTRAFFRQHGFNSEELSEAIKITEVEIDFEVEERLNKFDEELKKESKRCVSNGVYPSQVKLYELYEEKKSYKKVSELTTIPYKTVQRNVKDIREKILKQIND